MRVLRRRPCAAGGLYEVKDEEAEPNTTNRYFLEAHNVLPLPRSNSSREERPLTQGTPVLGVRVTAAGLRDGATAHVCLRCSHGNHVPLCQVYPGTTTFYRATVLHPPRRLPTGEFDSYVLQFEDDEVEGGGLGRPVDFRHVVEVRG